jgi:hypothetical protein
MQNKHSFMALKWCVENGVYPEGWEPESASKLLEEKKAEIKRKGSAAYLPQSKKVKKSGDGKKAGGGIIDDGVVDDSELGVGGWETGSSKTL